MDKIRVYALRLNKEGKPCKGYFMDIDNDANAWKEYVGGWPQEVTLKPGIVVICDEDGKLKNYLPNRAFAGNGHIVDYFVGDIFVCRRDEYHLSSINEVDIALVEDILLPIEKLMGNEIMCRPAMSLPEYKEK